MDGTNEKIKSLTWWNGRIYAAVKSNSKMRISVFSDEEPFEKQCNIDLPSDSKCNSLIVSTSPVIECDALFVLETCKSCDKKWSCDNSCECTKRIHKVEIIGNRIQINPFAVVDSGNPHHMTVTNKLLIVLVRGKERDLHVHDWHLEICSLFSTSRLGTINLPTEICVAYGVVESSSGHLIIPYFGYESNVNSGGSVHAKVGDLIAVVTYGGEIIQSLCLKNILPEIIFSLNIHIACAGDILIFIDGKRMFFIDIKLNNFKCLNQLHFYEDVSSVSYVRYGHRLIFDRLIFGGSGFGVLNLNPEECNIEDATIFSQCSDFFWYGYRQSLLF